MENKELNHVSVLLEELLLWAPSSSNGRYLDVTAGGGGHLCAFLEKFSSWSAEAWDRDPDAEARVRQALESRGLLEKVVFRKKEFSEKPENEFDKFDYILADLGVSSFQLDDKSRGMSLYSENNLDFRMDPSTGLNFMDWIDQCEERKLSEYLYRYAEEPRARALAKHIKSWSADTFSSAKVFADRIAKTLNYKEPSRRHPATRIFQALRIAINDELGQIESLLKWAPQFLNRGGRLAIISFHSLEDRLVKQSFQALQRDAEFSLPVKKPIVPSESEQSSNPRSRSAKLRVLERV
jgi:16S rRNA (cytosine1402-N4)-methyltransferase